MEKIIKGMLAVAAIALLIAFGVLCYLVFTIGMDRSEIVQCNKLKGQAAEFSDSPSNAAFYITRYEKDMCDGHGMFIKAVVK